MLISDYSHLKRFWHCQHGPRLAQPYFSDHRFLIFVGKALARHWQDRAGHRKAQHNTARHGMTLHNTP